LVHTRPYKSSGFSQAAANILGREMRFPCSLFL
jgi:hypothetical protein